MTEIDRLGIFEELGTVFECLCVGTDIAKLQLRSLVAVQLMSHYKNGRSLAESFFLICREHEAQFGNLFFGCIKPTYDDRTQELIASDQGRCFRVVLGTAKELLKISSVHATETIILYTDFKSFTFRRTDEAGNISSPFAVFSIAEMCEEIAFNGSIWDILYPTHYAIVSRTISYTFAQDTVGALFSTKPSATQDVLSEERSAYKRLSCLRNIFTRLLSLEALSTQMQACSRPPKLLSEHKEGSYTLRRYSPQRSSLFNFGEPAGELSRNDFVTTYTVGGEEFHREFFISPRVWGTYEEELQLAAFDILHMLAIRRAKLFRIGFASRVYNVLLPPVLLIDSSASSSYALFPCLNLYRLPKQGGFRRTLSMTFIASPIKVLGGQDKALPIVSRPAPLEELYKLKDNLLSHIVDPAVLKKLTNYTITGPIKSYIELPYECTIPELLRLISKGVLERVLTRGYKHDLNLEREVNSTLFTSNIESRIATISLQVEWTPPNGFTRPWERWLATGEDKVFCNSLFRTFFYWDYLDPQAAYTSRHTVEFEDFNIGNRLGGVDITGMTLYNPQESLKIIFYPRTCEKYPDFSLVRWMAWQVYIDSALTSMRTLIYKFHPILDDRGDLPSIIETLDDMVQEFVDFYDLDIREYDYRKEYEKLRTLMHVDSDYARLLSKFASSKEDASLREQRLINKLIVSLTLATVTITVVSTVAGLGELSVSRYLIIAFVLSTIMVWLGYLLFDPIRLGYERLYHAISKWWRLRL